jgi:exopolysaccharide biosynthesis protein
VAWRPGATGVEWGELQLKGGREAWRTRVVLVRIDPRQVDFSLVTAFTPSSRWTVADADTAAVVALDAGQFRQSLPWGWVVSKGHEVLPPEYAPLAGAVVVDPSGAVRVIAPDDVVAEHERGTAREAFQSYPMLLKDGVVPALLSRAGGGVNVEHRDARLALGTLADGGVLIALTRFDALGPSLGWVPLGLTSAEMAAVMGALGCRQALLLDGGISGQLLLREPDGSVRSWPGSRAVPLGLVALPKGSVLTD